MHTIKLFIKPVMGILAALSLFAVSCQKKFDPNSYKPAESFGGYSAASQIEPGALVAHFAFENNLLDSASNTSATGYGTTYSSGIKGKDMQVGQGNYAIFPATQGIQSMQGATIAFWMTTSQDTSIQEPICFVDSNQFWGNFDFFLDQQKPGSALVKIHAFGSGGAKEAWLQSWTLNNPWDVWMHIAVTYDNDANKFTFYVNGAEFADTTVAGFGPLNFSKVPNVVLGTIQFQTTPSLTSAATAQSWASFLWGFMDEVRIYNKPLTAAEIKSLYQLENYGF